MCDLKIIVVTLLSLQALLGTEVSGFKIYRPRMEILNMLKSSGEAAEERLYLDRCKHSNSDGKCSRALDGGALKEWTQCTSTTSELKPTWSAHLEVPSYVTRVVIHSSQLPDPDMVNALTSFELQVGGTTCYNHSSPEFFESKSFPCDALGEEVQIISRVTGGIMVLCEVELYGVPVTLEGIEGLPLELGFNGCEQSSSESFADECQNAIDRLFVQVANSKGKKCARTAQENGPWFAAHLEDPALVTNVKLFNRMDTNAMMEEMKSVRVNVNSIVCDESRTAFDTKIFNCIKFGNIIRVENRGKNTHLNLCQIQVFGHRMVINRGPSFQYLGCFADNPEDPDLENLVSGTWMTPAKCHLICKRKNASKFGLQNGHACLCGQKHGRHGESTNCTMTCRSDLQSICGGRRANSIYQIS